MVSRLIRWRTVQSVIWRIFRTAHEIAVTADKII